MRRLLLPLAMLAIAASPAHAAPRAPEALRYNCGYVSTPVPRVVVSGDPVVGDPDEYTAALYAFAVAADPADAATPVGVTIRCYLAVDGVEEASTAAVHGTTVAATVATGTYHATPGQTLDVCGEITLDGGGTHRWCGTGDPAPIPPQQVQDLVELVTGSVHTAVDPVACPLLGALAPGIPGLVDIDPSGDVTVEVTVTPPGTTGVLWDCP